MASTFAGVMSVGSLASSSSRVMDKLSSSSLGRRQSPSLRKAPQSSQIIAAAKELYFNKDGQAIKKLQVS